MKKRLLLILILGFVGWMGLNYGLDHKQMQFPLQKDDVKFISVKTNDEGDYRYIYNENFAEHQEASLVNVLNYLNLEPDKELQAQVEKTGHFWIEAEPVIELEVHFHFDFWQRTRYIWMMFYEDGHVALRYDGAYPKYYVAQTEVYANILDVLLDMKRNLVDN